MTSTKSDRFINLSCRMAAEGRISKLVFSKLKKAAVPTRGLTEIFSDGILPERITGRSASKSGEWLVAFEGRFAGGKVKHFHLPGDGCRQVLEDIAFLYMQVNLITEQGDAEYRCSAKGAENVRIPAGLLNFDGPPKDVCEGLDKKKNYILSGSEPFLFGLGITDAAGRIHDKRQSKFRQINRFLEYVSEVYETLPKSGRLVVYDLCCGKSYLSFAVYYYLTAIRGRELSMLCIDLKKDVIEECAQLAKKLCFEGMSFVCSDINAYSYSEKPHLVLSLHACDIATDIVLARAAALGADAILSTPCCHRTLNSYISPDFESFITSSPFLKVKLCETVTDALRMARLRMWGYSVNASELVTTEDTPKNTIITARRRLLAADSGELTDAAREYYSLLDRVCGAKADEYAAVTGSKREADHD